MVINCSSTGVSPVFQCMWEAAGYLLVHWDPITAGVLAFPETLASRRRKKKKKRGDSYRSRMSPLSSRRHIRRSRPRRSRRCISRGRKRTLRGEMETPWAGQRGKAGQAPSALGYFKKRFGLCLLASTYRINLNSRCAYLSSIPKYRD